MCKGALLGDEYIEILTLAKWKQLINAALPLYKMTYEACGCHKKFTKVWFHWEDSPVTLEEAPNG